MLPRISERLAARPERTGLSALFPPNVSRDAEVFIVVARPGDAVRAAGGTIADLQNLRVFQIGDGAPADLNRVIEAGFHSRKEYAAAMRERIERAFEQSPTHLGFESGRVSQQMAAISLALADIFRTQQPEVILSQPFEGSDPDEDATAFAVQAACEVLVNEGRIAPVRLEFATRGRFATHPYAESIALRLQDDQRARKHEVCAHLEIEPLDVEIFRSAPVYDFSQSLEAGFLQYDTGMTAARWRRMAAEALRVLGLG